MDGLIPTRYYRVTLLLVCVTAVTPWLTGCKSGSAPDWLTGGPTTDVVPGLTSPAVQMDRLRELARRASSATAEERQHIVSELAIAYRQESNPLIREQIVRTIQNYPVPEAALVLQEAVEDANAAVRIVGCEGLGQIGDPHSATHLAAVLSSDVDFDVRLAAAKALGRTGDPSALSALGTALADGDPAMQFQAIDSLKTLTGRDLGYDVNRWRQYVANEVPGASGAASVAERPHTSSY
jgi:HEAT repeat protein